MCFCSQCHTRRGDAEVFRRGDPSKRYALPLGWCRMSLHVPARAAPDIWDKYHIAYHGTKVSAVAPILHEGRLSFQGATVVGGTRVGIRSGHISKAFWRNRKTWRSHTGVQDKHNPPGNPQDWEWFDPCQVFMSPSIRYCTVGDFYAATHRFMREDGKRFKMQVQ